jgi:hypothetical protein
MVRRPREDRGRVVRVAWDGDTPVCFGDGPMADFADGEHVFVDVGTGNSTLLDEFAAQVRELAPELVADELILELVDHISLGHTPEEIAESFARLRGRRILALQP